MDDLERAFHAQLQLAIEASTRDFGKCTVDSDAAVALRDFQAQLEESMAVLADARLARSLVAAEHTDSAVIEELQREEERERRDRQLALALAGELQVLPDQAEHLPARPSGSGASTSKALKESFSRISITSKAPEGTLSSTASTKNLSSMASTSCKSATSEECSVCLEN